MREYMPQTHTDPKVVREYAEGKVGFDEIAEDRGPREATTLDYWFDQDTAARRRRFWDEFGGREPFSHDDGRSAPRPVRK